MLTSAQTYDAKLFPSLITTLAALLKAQPRAIVIISATVRNIETLDIFAERCLLQGLVIEDVEYHKPPADVDMGPFYSVAVPIRIMRIMSLTRTT